MTDKISDKTMKLKKRRIMTGYARLFYYFLITIGGGLTIALAIWWFSPAHIANNFSGSLHLFDFLFFILLSYVVWYQIINEVFFWKISFNMKHPVPMPPESNLKVALITGFVPSKEPYYVLERTLKAMVDVDYKHDTWILDEGNDPEAKRICDLYGAKHYSRKEIPEYNMESGQFRKKTKAGNFNSWFDCYSKNYDIIAQHDDDFFAGPYSAEAGGQTTTCRRVLRLADPYQHFASGTADCPRGSTQCPN